MSSEHTPGLVGATRVCYNLTSWKQHCTNVRRVVGAAKSRLARDAWRAIDVGSQNGGSGIPAKHENIAASGSADSVPSARRNTTANDGLNGAKTECGRHGSVAWIGSPKVTRPPNSSPRSKSEIRGAVFTVAIAFPASDSTP